MFEKQKITAILPAKSGIGRNGKPYSFCKIKTDRWGDKILTSFGDKVTDSWKIGDEVQLKVTESVSPDGKYTNYNFEYPKAPPIGLRLESLELRLQAVENYLKRLNESKLTSAGTPIPFDKESEAEFNQLPKDVQEDNLRKMDNLNEAQAEYNEINPDDIPF